ncbi:MAG: MBL fold metallo-hydrolase, partial [Cyanothece sp. SIO1E1]|nr:MBL fold metallo-hydrolase [Cyanothece sp. SIO1E1]
ATVYYEPHGFHSPTLKEMAPIDVVITPIIDVAIPLVGPIIKGTQSALEVATWLKPQVMLPTAEAGEVVYQGFLPSILKAMGSLAEFRAQLLAHNLSTQVIEPQPGKPFEVILERQ